MNEDKCSGENPGLWCNIHARRKAGKRPKKKGQKGYPKSLDIKEVAFLEAEACRLSLVETEEIQCLLEILSIEEASEVLDEKKCKGTESAPVGSPRQRSFCKRMCGHKKKNTGSRTATDPDSCIRQALRRWKCRCS